MRRTLLLALIVLLTTPCIACAAEMRGLLILGHEVHSFQPCEDTRHYWVNVPRELPEAYGRLAASPYEPVYMEFEGDLLDRSAEGFAADYAGVIEINEIRTLSRTTDARCDVDALDDVPATKTYVFVCDDTSRIVVRAEEEFAWVFARSGTLRLPGVSAASGLFYSDDRFDLYIDGENGRLGPRSDLQACRNDRAAAIWEKAKLDGVDFRAVGNEPGWKLEIRSGDRIVLVTDYGGTRFETPLPDPVTDREHRVTRWDAGELVLEVRGHPCRDDMSGEQFDAAVRVTWRGRTLSGCGRALH